MIKYSQITPEIFVGSQIYTAGKRKLISLGVNYSINMRSEFEDADHDLDLQNYCYLPTEDRHAPTSDQLETGIAFIRRVVNRGGKVYIHCRSGIGRAPTLAAAYLMSQGHSLDEAIGLISKVRPFIGITEEQMEKLRDLERQR